MPDTDTISGTKLVAPALRWRCDPEQLPFETTAEIDPGDNIVGQSTAWEALRFGIECNARGQNVYVRGMRGTGRMTMVRRMLSELKPVSEYKLDRCFVHNFSRPDKPRLLSFAAGQGNQFRRKLKEFAEFVRGGLAKALDAEHIQSERLAAQSRLQEKVQQMTAPLQAELQQAGMALVSVPSGPVAQTVIFPLVDGQPVPPDQFRQLAAQGKVSAEQVQQIESRYPEFQQRLAEIGKQINAVYQAGAEELKTLVETAARELLSGLVSTLFARFQTDEVKAYLDEMVDDVLDIYLQPADPQNPPQRPDPSIRYGVNIVLAHDADQHSPVVEENTPTLANLLGTIDPEWGPQGPIADYRGIRAGALLRADGGFLILDVNDVLMEPGAWKALMRTLRNGRLEIVPPEMGWMQPRAVLKPEAIDINVRVILIGDAIAYYQLDQLDADFSELFKVLADFDHEIVRDAAGVKQYAAVLAHLACNESLLPFHRSAVAALAEHGARIASRAGKLTANFGRVADISREASFLARQSGAVAIRAEQVKEAVRRTRARASLPSRKFQQLLNNGTIIVQTQGKVVGQINGLAVIQAGPLTYGFPSRITATIGAGRAGLINIEGQAGKSGSIHTKGFHILGGLLRFLLKTEHPLAFSASLAFEQSYGGIDGDSASGAEICCLLSALTNIPIKQSFAMTGAIDQHGHIEAIGGVNEKIEGFFDACQYAGFSGEQGVIIPQANAGDLMLRHDVVQACERNEFAVHAVATIQQALEILTDQPAGERVDGEYPEGSLLRMAVDQAGVFWRRTLQSPAQLVTQVSDEEEK